MLKIQFKRGRDVPADLANIDHDNRCYDLGIVAVLPICKNGEILEWATLEEIAQDIEKYNAQFPGEGFTSDLAYINLSLMKAVEHGLVHMRVVDPQPVVKHELTQQIKENDNGSRAATWWLDGREVLTLYQLRLTNGFSRSNVVTKPISGYGETLIYLDQIASAARCISQEWDYERTKEHEHEKH